MADENKESAKGAFIEKLLFALLPLLIGSTGYLISALGQYSTMSQSSTRK